MNIPSFFKQFRGGPPHLIQTAAAETLRDSENLYHRLFEASIDGILILDAETGMVVDVNPVLIKLLGYSQEQFLGKNIWELGIFKDIDATQEMFLELRQKEYIYYEDMPIKTADGREIDVEFISNLYLVDQYKVIQCNIRDISDRKQGTKALMERVERLHSLLASVKDGVWAAQLDGPILYVNPALGSIFGVPEHDFRKDWELWSKAIHPEDRHTFELNNLDLREKGHALDEYRVRRPNGEVRWINDLKYLVYDNDRPIWQGGIVTDITDRKFLEQKLKQSQKMESIGTLAGGIAHDINNILAAIIGYAELAKNEVPDVSQVHKDLDNILAAGERAANLVLQILTFSRQSEEERQPLNIVPIVKETMKMLRSTLPTSIEIELNIGENLGLINGDVTQVQQIIMNLCTNAAYAMKEHGGTLSCSLSNILLDEHLVYLKSMSNTMSPGNYVMISVTDTGTGIDPTIKDKIFEPYFTTKEQGEGTGLGLATIHGIVTSYGGAISVYSEVGKGTTMNVYLPESKESCLKTQDESKTKNTDRNEHILLVDDEKMLADVGKRLLENLGYSVTAKTSSREALELFRENHDMFDLVISDMSMPGMTGDELSMKMMEIDSSIPIIICTGFSKKMNLERARELGISAYVTKPLNKSNLSLVIRNVLDKEAR